MTKLIQDRLASETLSLLTCYGFELKGYSASILIHQWLKHFSSLWIRLAIIEALYQGRYKAISVEHILDRWTRLGQPNIHFPHEFERFICQKLPRNYLDNHRPFDVDHLSDRSQLSPKIQSSVEHSSVALSTSESAIALSNHSLVSPQHEAIKETTVTNHTKTEMALGAKTSFETSQVETKLVSKTKFSRKNSNINKSIRRFTPILDNSLLYNKLRAVAHGNLNLEYQ